MKITESAIEQFAVDLLESQGYTYIYGPDIAPDREISMQGLEHRVPALPGLCFLANGSAC